MRVEIAETFAPATYQSDYQQIGMIFVFRLSALKSLNKTLSPARRLPGFGSGSLMSGQNDKAEQPTHGKSGSVP